MSSTVNAALVEYLEAAALAAYKAWDGEAGSDERSALTAFEAHNDWPTAAVIDLSRLRSLDPASVAGSAGQLTPQTLGVLSTAVRTYLGTTDI